MSVTNSTTCCSQLSCVKLLAFCELGALYGVAQHTHTQRQAHTDGSYVLEEMISLVVFAIFRRNFVTIKRTHTHTHRHAHKHVRAHTLHIQTGHIDFSESTDAVKALSPEEKAAKLARMKELIAARRTARVEEEKVDHVKVSR